MVWLGDLRMKIQGPRVTLLFSLTSLMSSKQILAFLDTGISDFLSPKTRYSFQKIQLVTNGNSNYSGRSPRVLYHQPWHGKSMGQSFWKWNPFHASKIFNHQSFLWWCLKYVLEFIHLAIASLSVQLEPSLVVLQVVLWIGTTSQKCKRNSRI